MRLVWIALAIDFLLVLAGSISASLALARGEGLAFASFVAAAFWGGLLCVALPRRPFVVAGLLSATLFAEFCGGLYLMTRVWDPEDGVLGVLAGIGTAAVLYGLAKVCSQLPALLVYQNQIIADPQGLERAMPEANLRMIRWSWLGFVAYGWII